MGKQTIKQQARRAALDAQTTRRAEHVEHERRLQGLVVQVLVAIRERDRAVSDADQRAGQALTEMISTEGLTARDASQWCGGEVSAREVARLRRVAAIADMSGDVDFGVGDAHTLKEADATEQAAAVPTSTPPAPS